jgi:outer membrane protein assembly factor BamB
VGERLILNWGTAGVALDPADGRLLWLSGKNEWSYTSAVPGKWNGLEVLFVSAAEQLAAVGLDDGVIRWTEPFHVGFKASDPVRVGNKVFFGANETGGALVNFENEKATIAWNKADLGTFTGGAVFVDGFLYAIVSNRNDKGALTCIDPSTGTVQWGKGGFGWGSLIAAGDG